MEAHGEDEGCRGGIDEDPDVRDVECVDGDDDAVRAVPGGRGGADEPGITAVVGQLNGTLRQS